MSIQILCLFFKLSSLSLLLSYACSLFMLDKVPCQIWFVYIFSCSVSSFYFLNGVLWSTNVLLMKYSFYVAVFFVCFVVLQWSFERQKYGETHWILSVFEYKCPDHTKCLGLKWESDKSTPIFFFILKLSLLFKHFKVIFSYIPSSLAFISKMIFFFKFLILSWIQSLHLLNFHNSHLCFSFMSWII